MAQMKRFVSLAAILATAVMVMGCTGKTGSAPASPPAPQVQTIEISYDDLLNQKQVQRDVTITAGETLRVILGTNISTGYKWAADAQISDPAVLAQTGHVAIASPNGVPGGSGSEMWTFDTVNPGNATISTTYGQPWPGGEKDAWTFTAHVTVR